MERAKEKTVELFGRKFKIKKFDAFTGSYILFTIMQKVLPGGMETQIPGENAGNLSDTLPQNRTSMTKQEFTKLLKDCLSVVYETLPAGDRPVFNENGTWGLNDMQDNTPLVLLLAVNVLIFNIGDFFAANGLSELRKSLSGLSLANIKM